MTALGICHEGVALTNDLGVPFLISQNGAMKKTAKRGLQFGEKRACKLHVISENDRTQEMWWNGVKRDEKKRWSINELLSLSSSCFDVKSFWKKLLFYSFVYILCFIYLHGTLQSFSFSLATAVLFLCNSSPFFPIRYYLSYLSFFLLSTFHLSVWYSL